MICPRCSVAEISAETNRCVLCGYAPGGGAAVGVQVDPRDKLHDHVLQELEGQFRIERLLSKGPRTLVYAAREVESERKVALKVLARQPVREAGMEDRFTRDAAAAASLDHPHIVPIFRFGATAHLLWYSMKFIEGRSLSEILRATGPLELHACLRIVEQIASALQYAHRRGITHGDIRPGNVLVDAQEWALVTDFAIGRVLERIPGEGATADDAPARPPEYIAPEESYARQPGPGADQFALAVLVYEMLAGERPSRPPQPLVAVRPEIPVPFAEALLRAMHAQPTARFMNVMELVSVLGAGDPALVPTPRATPRPSANQRVLFVDGPARSRRWVWMGIGATLGLTAVGLAALQVINTPSQSGTVIDMPASGSPPPVPAPAPPPVAAVTPSPSPVSQGPSTPVRQTAPPRVAPAPRVAPEPGRLFINSTPWGQLYIDGELSGTTPLADLPIPAGVHRIRVVRQGFQAFELEVEVAPGQQVRLTDIVLQPSPPAP